METITDENIIHGVKKIETTNSKDEANALLSKGWVLLEISKGQEQTGANDYTPFFMFCLGRVG